MSVVGHSNILIVVYTLPQKKCNFFEVAFLLWRSVGQRTLGQRMWDIAPGNNDPGSLTLVQGHHEKIWKLRLHFFWGRV